MATVALRLMEPTTLGDVEQFLTLARACGFHAGCAASADGFNHGTLQVSSRIQYLAFDFDDEIRVDLTDFEDDDADDNEAVPASAVSS